jgi:type I restriction enzyme S subunit
MRSAGIKIRFLCERQLTIGQRDRLYAADEVTFLPMEAIGEDGSVDMKSTRAIEDVRSGYTRFFDGDVVIAKITPCFENGKGALVRGLLNGVGFGTTELHVVTPGPHVDARFLYYLTAGSHFRRMGEANMIGAAGQKRVPTEFVLDYRVPVLDTAQQRAIAHYLDAETARIDALIAAKERLLTILAEKRRAVITQAVTRGLDPNVPMRDSGIPWLGEIPAHWKSVRLKHVATVQGGLALGKKYAGSEPIETYPYLRVANVQDGFVDLGEVKTVDVSEHDARSCRLRTGDVLMNEGGDADKLGRGAIWNGEIDPCLHQNHVFAVRPEGVTAEWLNLWTCSDGAKAFFESRSKQSTNLASISATNVKELPIPLPPGPEQLRTVALVASQVAKLDAFELATSSSIALLCERREAVIAAAVTGQLDVGAP